MSENIIDVDKLEKELVSALEADRKYSRENDAKFRAVNQRVATYEEFRDIVKASHLTSLDRDDLIGRKGRQQPWNPAAPTRLGGEISCHHGNTHTVLTHTHTQPTSIQEFLRRWKDLKSSPEEQYSYLLYIGGQNLRELFKVEISMGLLGEFLVVLNLCFTQLEGDSDAIMEILQVFPSCPRFALALRFLGKDERTACQQLLQKLRATATPNPQDTATPDPQDTTTSCSTSKTTSLQELTKLYIKDS